jgi:hypothetical protein
MKRLLRAAGMAMLGALSFFSVARAQISEPGPYYSLPSWDQQLPASTRWITLTNWGSAAVLDRETGLVWQQNPTASEPFTWAQAVDFCRRLPIGGRYGWRLPSLEELMTLVDPSTLSLFSGAPLAPLPNFFWTASTVAENTNNAFLVSFVPNGSGPLEALKADIESVWCVRGYQGAQSPQ